MAVMTWNKTLAGQERIHCIGRKNTIFLRETAGNPERLVR